MTTETLRHFLAWCTLMNYILLILWAGLTLWAPGFLRGIAVNWYGVPEEKCYSLNYAGLMAYKLGIILFNLIPYLALRIMA